MPEFNEVCVCEAFDPTAKLPSSASELKQCKAIWDTGATATCISCNVAQERRLQPSSRIVVSGSTQRCMYWYSRASGGFGMLIGMDIIRSGDFSISHFNNRTTFSVRGPSVEETDYNKELDAFNKRYAPKVVSKEQRRKDHNRKKEKR